MEDWQRNHICKNLDVLVDLTECNYLVIATLKSRGVLSKEDVDILTTAGLTEGKTCQNYKFYEILETRDEGYGRLMEALKRTQQSGVLKILQQGEKMNAKFLSPPSAVKTFLKQKIKSVLIWSTTDAKLTRLWIQQTMRDDDNDFDVECNDTENFAEILKDPPSTKQICIVEANLQEIEIILKSSTNPENIDVTSIFPAWTDLTIRYQEQLKQRTVKLLGKETKFEDILAKLESFEFPLETFTGNFLIDLINDKRPCLIQSKEYPAQNSYINRTLHSHRMIPIDSIEKFPVEANDIFTFTGFEDMNEATRVLKLDYDLSTAVLGKAKISNRFILLQSKGDYQLICMKTSLEKPVHLLQYAKDTQTLLWVTSRGNLKSLRRLMLSEVQEMTEEQLLDAEIQNFGKHIVITGDPGMGKTSVLLNLIKNYAAFRENTIFVKYYVFRDFINLLEKETENSKTLPAKLQITNALTYSFENEFEKEIFQLFLKNKEIACLLMLDGYDELQENQQNVAKHLLKTIPEIQNIKIIVTSRRHRVAELEDLLNTVVYELQPFSTDDQLKFLITFWRSKGGIEDERLQQYGKTCLGNWKPVHKTHEKPMGEVPLHCQLLAEVFEAEAIKYSNPNNDLLKDLTLPTTLISSVSEIYSKLMAKKREQFETRYGNEECNRIDFLLVNTAIQLLTPFSDYWLHHLCTEGKRIDGTEAELEKMLLFGVMKAAAPDKVFTFTHQSIAEYIIAEYVVKVLRKEIPIKDWDSFVGYFIFDVLRPIANKVRISRDFTVDDDNAMDGFHFHATGISFFIDELLETGPPKIPLIHSIFPELTKEFWSSWSGSRIVACILGDLLNIAKLFLSLGSMNNLEPRKEEAINLLNLTAMFSSKAFMKEIRNFIQETGMYFPIESIYKILDYPNGISYPLTPLHTAVERGNYDLVVYLINNFGFGDLLHKLKNLLHACVYLSAAESQPVIQDKKRIITLLVERNPYIKDELHDYYGVPPILRDYIHIEILQHLAGLLADVNATTSNAPENLGEGKNLTVLHKHYLYRGLVNPLEYHNLLLRFHQAGYNCWSSIAVRSNYIFQISDRIVRYLDASDETLDFLAEQGVDFSQIDAVGNSMVMVAVYFGRSTRFIRKLIQLGGDWKRFAPKGDGILNEAVRKNNTSLITMLVKEFGADISRPTENDAEITPIHCSACLCNFKDMMNMIIFLQNLGGDINATDKKQCTLFHAAAAKSRINVDSLPMSANELHEFVMFLKSENFKHFSAKDYRGCTALHYTLQYCEPFPATVQFLINSGTDINSMDNQGYTPIMYAVEGGRSAKFLEALVQRNADLTMRGLHGTTLLHQAVVHGNSDALEYLSKSIYINMRDNKMRTPLHYLLYAKPFEKIVATLNGLMRLGSNINSTDSSGNTMFNYAFDIAPKDVHSLILAMHKFGFNWKLKNKNKMSILHGLLSQIECLEETLVFLQIQGVKINCRNEWGHTPLMCAIKGVKSTSFVKMLLKNGADPHLKSKSGDTCLHLAVRTGNLEIVQMLITEYKLDVNSLGNDVGCPIHGTIFIKSFDLLIQTIKLLVSLGADVNVTVEGQTFLHLLLRLHIMPLDINDSFQLTPSMFHELVKYLDSVGFQIAQNYDKQGASILQVAVLVLEPMEATLQLFKSRHEDFNAIDKVGQSLLFYAMEDGSSPELIRLLIKYGAKVDMCNYRGETIIHYAAMSCHIQAICQFVEEYEMDINCGSLGAGYTPLHVVVGYSPGKTLVQNVLSLIQLGADVNATDKHGNTVLHYNRNIRDEKVMLRKLYNICTYVQRQGDKDVDAQACEEFCTKLEFGQVPTLSGAEFDALIKCLDKLGFDFKARNNLGTTVLYSVMHWSQEELLDSTLEFLLSKGLSLNDVDHLKESAFRYAVGFGRGKIFINRLLKYEPDLNAKNGYEENVLHCAARDGNIEAAQLFIEIKKELIDEVDEEGFTPFHLAIQKATKTSLQVAKLLAGNGAKIDTVAKNGFTPHLHYLFFGEKIIAKLLLEFEEIVAMTAEVAYANFKCLLMIADKQIWNPSDFRFLALYFQSKCGNLLTMKNNGHEAPLLHQIVDSHSFFGVKYLVEEVKVDVNAADKLGKTALQSMKCFCKIKPREFMITNECKYLSDKCVNIVKYLIKFDRVVKAELRKR